MSRLTWDRRDHESGLDRGVFYPRNSPGEAWNGLTAVRESPSNADDQTRYIDGRKTYFGSHPGEFSGAIEAFTYPDSFYEHVLTQHQHQNFGLSYRVKTGDGYKIHLVYNIFVEPSTSNRQMGVVDPFVWNFTTKALPVPGARMSAHLVIDTSIAYSWTLSEIEDVLYGSDTNSPRLPSPEEVLAIFEDNSILKVVDNGDGTFTVSGPDEVIQMIDPTTFEISWPSAVYIDEVSYTISSL